MSIIAIVAALALAGVIGWRCNRRTGVVRAVSTTAADAAVLEPAPGRPTVVHFSAPWCGPCAQLRRVVEQVCEDLGGVAHREIDIDADPAAARAFAVLSLPTTLIFDADGRQRFRAAGVPSVAALRSALQPLLA